MCAPLKTILRLGAALAVLAMVQNGAAAADTVRIERASVSYRIPGEFLDNGLPVNAPMIYAGVERSFDIMKRQVTRGEYERCSVAGACKPLDGAGDPDLPATGVSWDDATAYANWLSRETGEIWRLPTDREWALAAGSRYRDDAYTEISDPANPSRRWIATYNAEVARQQEEVDTVVRPAGSFGVNENGLEDHAGNVWEWTDTCYIRYRKDAKAGASETENCGVRIAQGRHRAYMSSFFRDPKAGACSVGIPPAHLGIRLVHNTPGRIDRLRDWLGW
jgi:formylglycine-generating enzyme required for sulfatase activity